MGRKESEQSLEGAGVVRTPDATLGESLTQLFASTDLSNPRDVDILMLALTEAWPTIIQALQATASETGFRDLAHEAFLQLEYLHQRERQHSSTGAVLLRLSEKLGLPLDAPLSATRECCKGLAPVCPIPECDGRRQPSDIGEKR